MPITIALLLIFIIKQILFIRFLQECFENLYNGKDRKIKPGLWFAETRIIRLYDKMIDKIKEINFTASSHERLYKISYLINNMEFSETLFDEIIKNLAELFDAEKGSIMLVNNHMELQIFGAIGMKYEIRKKTRVKKGEGI